VPHERLTGAGVAKRKKQIDEERAVFNSRDNVDGSKVRVVIAESTAYEAGVSFLGVRRLVLVDVPMTWASSMQRIGRALRFCGHEWLPKDEKTVELKVFVAKIEETTDEHFIRRITTDNAQMIGALDRLKGFAVDRHILKAWARVRVESGGVGTKRILPLSTSTP
jgi:hypothetical protein